MTRQDIMDDCPEEFEDRLKEIVDHLETVFDEIKEKLGSIGSIDDLDRVSEAYSIAEKANSDLY